MRLISFLKKLTLIVAPMAVVYGTMASLNIVYGDICKRINGLDIPFHIAGGAAAAWAGFLLYSLFRREKSTINITPRPLFYLYLIGITALIGILWEHYEFLHDYLAQSIMQPSLTDTMKDLANDLLGALLFCVALSIRARNKKLKPGEY